MTHHAGLPSDSTNGMVAFGDDQDALTRSEFHNLVQELKQAHVTNPPNTAFSYSNLGYSLLGHTVERVTGQEFSDYMDEAILRPLGMESSSFTLRADMKPRLSKEYLNGEAAGAHLGPGYSGGDVALHGRGPEPVHDDGLRRWGAWRSTHSAR